jgi:hypothetical protein
VTVILDMPLAQKGRLGESAIAAPHTSNDAFSCFPLLPPASPLAQMMPGKQKTPRRAPANYLIFLRLSGAGEGIRTLDPNLGKVVLYP